VDCGERARVAFKAATENVGGPWEAIAADWTKALNHLPKLRMRNCDRTAFAHIELLVAGVVADLFPGVLDLTLIRRRRSQADREDDRLTDLRAIDGPHVVSNKEMAKAYRNAAAANIAAAQAYEQLDREERRNANKTIARLRETAS
jgi:hypothetical protein